MAQFLIELALLDTASLAYPPSMLAAAAIFTAAELYNTGKVVPYTGYTQKELSKCCFVLLLFL
jgi:hypothetical protein